MRHPLLQKLKEETSTQHQALEQHLDLLRPAMSLHDYRVLLERFYGFYAPWEQHAAPLLNRALPDFFEERRKTPLLEKDLRRLQSNLAAVPRCSSLPETNSLPTLFGSLYVLEGATLGGQILTRHFAQQFSLSDQEGVAFFSSYGPVVGQRWRAFCELLAFHSSPGHDRVIVHSAVQTFRRLGRWLGQSPDAPAPASLSQPN